MKGVVAIAAMLIAAILTCNMAMGNPPLKEPRQYEQFCENQKVAGTGVVDVSTSIVDKKLALEYYNIMTGDGDFELDQTNAFSQNSSKLARLVNGTLMPVNLYETTKMTYSGATPLVGGKYIHSKSFYGGIGADVQEMYSVNQMEKDQTSFFASTLPNTGGLSTKEFNDLLGTGSPYPSWTMNSQYNGSPAHLVGIDTKNSFNGTWGTDAKWHKIFYKDIKSHEMFTGTFETEKLIKFHEAPFNEPTVSPCAGIDC